MLTSAMNPPPSYKVVIDVRAGNLIHNGQPCELDMNNNSVKVGCTLVTHDAIEFIYEYYKEAKSRTDHGFRKAAPWL